MCRNFLKKVRKYMGKYYMYLVEEKWSFSWGASGFLPLTHYTITLLVE
jgi:hypothetical protein